MVGAPADWYRADTLVRAPAHAMAWGGCAASLAVLVAGALVEAHTTASGWMVRPLLALTIPLALFGAAPIVRRAHWHVRADAHEVAMTIGDAHGRTWKREAIALADVSRAIWTPADSEYPTGLTLIDRRGRALRLPAELVDEAAAREFGARCLPGIAIERGG